MIAHVFRASLMPQLHRLALLSNPQERANLDQEIGEIVDELQKLRTAIADVQEFEAWYAADVAARQMQ